MCVGITLLEEGSGNVDWSEYARLSSVRTREGEDAGERAGVGYGAIVLQGIGSSWSSCFSRRQYLQEMLLQLMQAE